MLNQLTGVSNIINNTFIIFHNKGDDTTGTMCFVSACFTSDRTVQTHSTLIVFRLQTANTRPIPENSLRAIKALSASSIKAYLTVNIKSRA